MRCQLHTAKTAKPPPALTAPPRLPDRWPVAYWDDPVQQSFKVTNQDHRQGRRERQVSVPTNRAKQVRSVNGPPDHSRLP